MTEEFKTLVHSFGALRLVDGQGTSELSGSKTTGRSSPYQDLVVATRAFNQAVKDIAVHIRQIRLADRDQDALRHEAIAQVISLRRKANDLAATIAKFTDAADIYLVAYIISLASASAGTRPARLLSHFDARLKSIARDVVSNSTIDEESVLREILERCYSQAVDAQGALNCNDYYIPLDYPVNPYDPDFESEQYYEHEDRLDIDEVNTAWFARECERRANNPEKREEEWIGFWFQALGNCPHGPTLFNPQTSVLQCRDFPYLWRLTDVPRYLCRAFDVDSFGQSDERVVASAKVSLRSLGNEAGSISFRGPVWRPHECCTNIWITSVLD
jgi:hypothetical protein